MITFGEKLRKIREEKALTRFDLSQLSGIRESTIYSIEKGDRAASEDNLKKLSKVDVLGLTYEEMKAMQILSKASPGELDVIMNKLLMPEPIWELLRDARMKRVLQKIALDPEYKQEIFNTIPENRE